MDGISDVTQVPTGEPANGRPPGCFLIPQRRLAQPCTVTLDPGTAGALAALLPLLGCGEEAAILGFDHLAAQQGLTAASRKALQSISSDERVHDALLRGLQAALPPPPPAPALRSAARRFHRRLQMGGVSAHVARIAGVDAAVCTILSRLLRPAGALAGDATVAAILGHIRRDEARHVAISRAMAMAASNSRIARDASAEARDGLADLLVMAAPAFEQLGSDPDRLIGDVRRQPHGLFS